MTEQPIDLEVAASSFGIRPQVLSLALSHMSRSDDFPYLQFPMSHRPTVIYLDLLHWVGLAKAHLGRPETDESARAYETLVQAASQYRVVVPTSAALYMEISRIGSLRQRTDLADTIGMISGFVTLGSASLTTDVQLRNALAKRFGGENIQVSWPFGIGSGFAFGVRGGMRIRTVDDVPTSPPSGHLSPNEMILTALGEYMLLRGPTPDEIPNLRALGYRPEAAREMEIDRVRHEQYLKDQLEARPDLRRKIGDIVAARHLYWELGDVLQKAPHEIRHYPGGILLARQRLAQRLPIRRSKVNIQPLRVGVLPGDMA